MDPSPTLENQLYKRLHVAFAYQLGYTIYYGIGAAIGGLLACSLAIYGCIHERWWFNSIIYLVVVMLLVVHLTPWLLLSREIQHKTSFLLKHNSLVYIIKNEEVFRSFLDQIYSLHKAIIIWQVGSCLEKRVAFSIRHADYFLINKPFYYYAPFIICLSMIILIIIIKLFEFLWNVMHASLQINNDALLGYTALVCYLILTSCMSIIHAAQTANLLAAKRVVRMMEGE